MAMRRAPEVQKKVASYNDYFESGVLDEQFNQLLNDGSGESSAWLQDIGTACFNCACVIVSTVT